MDWKKLLTPRWIITTLLVVVAVGVMVYLGVWQLDRLEQRQAFNARVGEQIASPALDLNHELSQNTLSSENLNAMEYRKVVARGEYNFAEQVVLRNQVWESQPGFHLLTPLYLEGTNTAILVDRGWIPLDQKEPAQWTQYDETGVVEVEGQILLSQDSRVFGVPDPTLAPDQTRLAAWNAVRLNRIRQQVEGELLPVYVMAAPTGSMQVMPYRALEQPDLSEGSHQGYAIQWFSFAAILAVGYPFFVRKQLSDAATAKAGYTGNGRVRHETHVTEDGK